MAKMGAPTKYKKQYCKDIIEFCKSGLKTIEMYATHIDVHTDSLYEWAKKHPEFSVAIKKAKQINESEMMKLGLMGASGQIKNYRDATWIFWMKARFKWREADLTEEKDDPNDFSLSFKEPNEAK